MSTVLSIKDVTIANGAAVSDVIKAGGAMFVGIQMPADWTAANLTILGSAEGDTYYDVYIAAGTEYVITAAEDRYIILDPALLAGLRFFKIRSGVTATPVNQGAERVLKIVMRA